MKKITDDEFAAEFERELKELDTALSDILSLINELGGVPPAVDSAKAHFKMGILCTRKALKSLD